VLETRTSGAGQDQTGADAVHGVRPLNLAVAFLLEVGALVAVCFAAATLHVSLLARVVAGVAAPGVMALAWARYAAPKAPTALHGLRGAAFRFCWFGVAVLALVAVRHASLALALGVCYLVNAGMLRISTPAPSEVVESH
jgi:hypothetical protein